MSSKPRIKIGGPVGVYGARVVLDGEKVMNLALWTFFSVLVLSGPVSICNPSEEREPAPLLGIDNSLNGDSSSGS